VARLARDAARTGRPIAFDTQALIGFLEGREPVASLLRRLIADHEVRIAVSTVSIAEVLTRPAQTRNRSFLDKLLSTITNLPRLTVHALDDRAAVETAIVRVQTNLKLPDAAIVATARQVNALAIIGNDRQWRNRDLGVPYVHLDDIMNAD
jgi:predicted nucleic acid-binding protein